MFLGNPPIKSPLSSIFFARSLRKKDTRQRGFYQGWTFGKIGNKIKTE